MRNLQTRRARLLANLANANREVARTQAEANRVRQRHARETALMARANNEARNRELKARREALRATLANIELQLMVFELMKNIRGGSRSPKSPGRRA